MSIWCRTFFTRDNKHESQDEYIALISWTMWIRNRLHTFCFNLENKTFSLSKKPDLFSITLKPYLFLPVISQKFSQAGSSCLKYGQLILLLNWMWDSKPTLLLLFDSYRKDAMDHLRQLRSIFLFLTCILKTQLSKWLMRGKFTTVSFCHIG